MLKHNVFHLIRKEQNAQNSLLCGQTAPFSEKRVGDNVTSLGTKKKHLQTEETSVLILLLLP